MVPDPDQTVNQVQYQPSLSWWQDGEHVSLPQTRSSHFHNYKLKLFSQFLINGNCFHHLSLVIFSIKYRNVTSVDRIQMQTQQIDAWSRKSRLLNNLSLPQRNMVKHYSFYWFWTKGLEWLTWRLQIKFHIPWYDLLVLKSMPATTWKWIFKMAIYHTPNIERWSTTIK